MTRSCWFAVSRKKYGNDITLLPNQTYTLKLDYPLERAFTFQFKTDKSGMGILGLVGKIQSFYRKVYAAPVKYGVWGHDIDDLTITSISVSKKNLITIEVGS